MDNYYFGLKKYRSLLGNLIVRDIKVKYRRSFLGIVWSVLNPLLMMIVITIVFSTLFRFNIDNFPIYYLTGSLLFNFFNESTTGSMYSICGNAALIKKVYVPKYIFPLEKNIFGLVNLGFSFIAILIVLIFEPVEPSLTIFFIVVPIFFTFVFSVGMSMFLAAASVFFRDLYHIYGVVITAWMYLTPIFYPMDILPDWAYALVYKNPLARFVMMFRDAFMYQTLPSFHDIVFCSAVCIISLFVGVFVFKKTQDKFILHI